MEKHLESARSLMVSGGYTCVLTNGKETLTSTDRGVKPLLQWVNAGLRLTGFSAADKVVGKATAFLYCLLDVREVYTPVISAAARQVLENQGIRVIWEQEVPFPGDPQNPMIPPSAIFGWRCFFIPALFSACPMPASRSGTHSCG